MSGLPNRIAGMAKDQHLWRRQPGESERAFCDRRHAEAEAYASEQLALMRAEQAQRGPASFSMPYLETLGDGRYRRRG